MTRAALNVCEDSLSSSDIIIITSFDSVYLKTTKLQSDFHDWSRSKTFQDELNGMKYPTVKK